MGGNNLESTVQQEKGVFCVERKFSVVHYESQWPPYEQREANAKKKSRFMSDLLNKKIVRPLREDITSRTFETMEDIKNYVLDYVSEKITKEDFGDMADIAPETGFRIGRGNKFYEYKFQWFNPDDKSLNDPWFAIRITKRG